MGTIEAGSPPKLPVEVEKYHDLYNTLAAIGVIRTLKEKTDRAGWQFLVVGGPRQRKDGSLDPTLELVINNRPLTDTVLPEVLMSIGVSYSPKKVLTIKGAETTFKAVVTEENTDISAISAGLDKALNDPAIHPLDRRTKNLAANNRVRDYF